MTREGFIRLLCASFGETAGDICSAGREKGWLEQEDELFRHEEISRKCMARIIHMYLLKEKGIADLPDISKAQVLHDLYDCRVCANHVAQVYLRGIMDAGDLAVNGGFLWFDLAGTVDEAAIKESIRRTVETVSNYKEKG